MKRKLKGFFAIFLSVMLLSFTSLGCFAQSFYENFYAVSAEIEGEPVPDTVHAKAAVLMDAGSGKILMGKNINKKLYPASVTKIMTMLLVMENIDNKKISLSDKVTASAEAAGKGGSQIWLKENEVMSVNELLKATAIYSANDACTALGEHIAGSESAFVSLMNSRARELGMENTHFDNCTGLDDNTKTHLTTAKDIATMSRELLKHEKIFEYTTVWMDSLRNGETQLVNTNKLIRFYKGATGLKTGTTSKAGCCISASAKRDNLHLIAVVLGSENSKERFSDARQMLDWGFANYKSVTPKIDEKMITDVKIIGGTQDKIRPTVPNAEPVIVKKGSENKIETKIEICIDVKAPVEKNQILGKIKIMSGKKEIASYDLKSPKRVRSLTFGDIFVRLLKSIV